MARTKLKIYCLWQNQIGNLAPSV